jgi:Zn-dependent protease
MELRLGSIPIKVHGSFLLVSLFLGMSERDPLKLALWVSVVLASVLVHEFGHALMGKAFGLKPRIELQGMGGLTSFEAGRAELSTAKSIAVSLAGPFAGFLLAGLVVGLGRTGARLGHPFPRDAFTMLLWVNLGWGFFNLMPMLPLDGGNVLRAVALALSESRGERIARGVSIATAAGLGLLSLHFGLWWVLYLAVLHAFQNVQALRGASQQRIDAVVLEAVREAHLALERGDLNVAEASLEPVVGAPASLELRRLAVRLYARSLLQQALWSKAMALIAAEHRLIGQDELEHYAAGMRELGRDDDARTLDALCREPSDLGDFRA